MLLFIAYKIKRTFVLSSKTPKESNIYKNRIHKEITIPSGLNIIINDENKT